MRLHIFTFFFFCIALTLSSTSYGQADAYPAAEGFNQDESDEKAISIAHEVMEAMGGYDAWNDSRYLRWTFFGRRTLLWDKWTGKVRIDILESKDVYVVDVHTDEGQIWLNGKAQSEPDTIQKYLSQAKSIWINDSYWLVMPFKLKDSGVTLKYIETVGAEDSLRHKLQLTFQEVGDTPENKYWVFVNDQSKLIDEWQFFTRFDDEEARFSTPWLDYNRYGNILLSGDRGRAKLTDIGVYKAVSETVFSDPATYVTDDWE
jgi:plasmid maintenance system killer protein